MELKDYLKIAGVTPTINMEEELIKFFKTNDEITESKIEVLVDGLGIESKAFFETLYTLMKSRLKEDDDEDDDDDDDAESDDMDSDDMESELPVGKHNDMADEEFDAEQLEMGVAVEMEHTDNAEFAKAIAKDHLAELADYYTRLAQMVEYDMPAADEESDDDMDADVDLDEE